ncbi:hypothetical protein E2C01_083208 [Portunus trituberculatus]|uniref:Uncharacterized protein n=1 Tax=Portunus trituberculatus TaxID=210409 RepID=A0A5B7J3W5_PORTR|nr:hypothetical protein [Portunus trituberculatus]
MIKFYVQHGLFASVGGGSSILGSTPASVTSYSAVDLLPVGLVAVRQALHSFITVTRRHVLSSPVTAPLSFPPSPGRYKEPHRRRLVLIRR